VAKSMPAEMLLATIREVARNHDKTRLHSSIGGK